MLQERKIQAIFDEHFPKQAVPSPVALRIKQQISQRTSMAAASHSIQQPKEISLKASLQNSPNQSINGVLFSPDLLGIHQSETASALNRGRAYLWPRLEQAASAAMAGAAVLLLLFIFSFLDVDLLDSVITQQNESNPDIQRIAMVPTVTRYSTTALVAPVSTPDNKEPEVKIIPPAIDPLNPFPNSRGDGNAVAMIITPTPRPTASPKAVSIAPVNNGVAESNQLVPTPTMSATPTVIPPTAMPTIILPTATPLAVAIIITPTPRPTTSSQEAASIAPVNNAVTESNQPVPTPTPTVIPPTAMPLPTVEPLPTAIPTIILPTATPVAVALNDVAPALIETSQDFSLPTPNTNLAQQDIILVPTSTLVVEERLPAPQPIDSAISNAVPTPLPAAYPSVSGVLGSGPIIPADLAVNRETAIAQGIYIQATPTPIPTYFPTAIAAPNAIPTLLPPHAISPTPTSWPSPTALPTATSTRTMIPTATPLPVQPTYTPMPTHTPMPPTSVATMTEQSSADEPTSIPAPTSTSLPPTSLPPTSLPPTSLPSEPTATSAPQIVDQPMPPPTATPRRKSSNDNQHSEAPPTATSLPPTPLPPPTMTPVPPMPTETPYRPTNTPIPPPPVPTNTAIVIDVVVKPGVPDNTPIPTVAPPQPTPTSQDDNYGPTKDAKPTYGPTPTPTPRPTKPIIIITQVPAPTVAPTAPPIEEQPTQPVLPTAPSQRLKPTETPRPERVIVQGDCESDLIACVSEKSLSSENK